MKIRGTAILMLGLAGVALAGCETLPFGRKGAPAPAAPAPVVAAPEPAPVAPPPVVRPAPPVAARSCVPKGLAPPPRYPDTDAALRKAPGAADRYQLMAAGRLLRQKRLDELERAIAGCR
ncbi:hypothetical protein ACO2Q0_14955 [Phenylobacterium sp. VNQ135]|uniref:hypothetical protein n=1 Tax=Phenylobacterium sp. VNQ135 TaxID=3400922 RepID=UPI003C1135DB